MQETHRIEDQLTRAFRGPAWHGPALQELLAGVGPEKAAHKPLAAAHSIWEIVLHIAAWQEAVCRRIEGQALQLTDREDWPPVPDASEAEWKLALGRLECAHEVLRGAVTGLSDSRLTERVPGRSYDLYFMLHGVIQHNLYHAGQIAILKRG